MEPVGDPDAEKNPDVWELFRHYDELYFRGALVDAAFTVDLTSPRMRTTSCFGSCSFGKVSNTITLYEPMLMYRTSADLKNALLHLMIHGIIFVKHGRKCISSHGPAFRDWMDAINACSIEDHMRPIGGYRITNTHDFSPNKSCSIQGFLWKCESCGVTLVRAKKLGPPSDSCCIENYSQDATCGNILCYWHNHKMNCGGTYVLSKSPETPGQNKVLKGRRRLLSGTSEIKSLGTVQESDSDELQENATVAKPNAKDFQLTIVLPAAPKRQKPKQEVVASEKHKLFSRGSCNDAKSLVSSSSKKAGKKNRPEDFQETILLPAALLSKLKRKRKLIASEKRELFSIGSSTSIGTSTSTKAGKLHKQKEVEKSTIRPAPQKKLKLVQDLVASEKYGVFNAKPPGSSTSRKAGKLHKLEVVEESSVPAAAVPKRRKLEQDLVALEKHEVAKPTRGITTDKVGKLHKPEGVRKACVVPLKKLKPHLVASEKNELSSAKVVESISSKRAHKNREHEENRKHISRSMLKQPKKPSSSFKAGKQHKPEDFQKTIVQPAASRRKPKQSNRGVPERQKTRSKTRSFARKKEYACFSVWQNIYESECSSGSAEPLVNKRTERRRRQRERLVQMTKRITSGEEVSSQQTNPPSQCLEMIVIDPADQVQVVTQDHRDQFQPLARCTDIVVVPPAEQMMAQAPRGQPHLPAQCMDIVVIPPVELLMTQTHRDPSDSSSCFHIVGVPPVDQAVTRAPVDQSQPPAPCSIATDQVVPLHSTDPPGLTPSNPSSSHDLIDISDDD